MGVCATVMVLTIAVWDPQAAVPGLTYQGILAGLGEAGVNATTSVLGLVLWGAVGFAMALAVSVLAIRRAINRQWARV